MPDNQVKGVKPLAKIAVPVALVIVTKSVEIELVKVYCLFDNTFIFEYSPA